MGVIEKSYYSLTCDYCGFVHDAKYSEKKYVATVTDDTTELLYWRINKIEDDAKCPSCVLEEMMEGKTKGKKLKLLLEKANTIYKHQIINFLKTIK